jgi:hypothetical protein
MQTHYPRCVLIGINFHVYPIANGYRVGGFNIHHTELATHFALNNVATV